MKIAVIRSNELRHKYLSSLIADLGVDLLDLVDMSAVQARNSTYSHGELFEHFASLKKTEHNLLADVAKKYSSNLRSIAIDSPKNSDAIDLLSKFQPNIIITFGCSIIPELLISMFKDRFLGVHLGISPYYRGSGSNFWPFFYDEIACVGFTLMNLDAGVDTGQIIHQERAKIHEADDLHTIGVNCSIQMSKAITRLIVSWPRQGLITSFAHGRYFRRADFNLSAIKIVNEKIKEGSVRRYLALKRLNDQQFPIVDAFKNEG